MFVKNHSFLICVVPKISRVFKSPWYQCRYPDLNLTRLVSIEHCPNCWELMKLLYLAEVSHNWTQSYNTIMA